MLNFRLTVGIVPTDTSVVGHPCWDPPSLDLTWVRAWLVGLVGVLSRRPLLFGPGLEKLRPMLSRCRTLVLLRLLDRVTLEARTSWVWASTCPLLVDRLRLLMLCRVRLWMILVTPPMLLAVSPLMPSPH